MLAGPSSGLLTIKTDCKPDRRCPVSLTVVTSIHPLSVDYNTGKQRANACRLISGGKLRRRRTEAGRQEHDDFRCGADCLDGGWWRWCPDPRPDEEAQRRTSEGKRQRFMCARARVVNVVGGFVRSAICYNFLLASQVACRLTYAS